MGQKVNPHGLRVGVIQDWDSKWYADKNNFSDFLIEDKKIREYVKKKLYMAGISRILIERAANDQLRLTILTGKPGMIIGRSGAGIDELKADLEKLTKKNVSINIVEVRRTELDAQLTAESIAQALERRVSFRRAMKQAIGRSMKLGAKGIKVKVGGRLAGAEIARSETYHEGTIPLQTIRADIDYGFAEAHTTYGRLGVKVWIYKGEILKGEASAARVNKAPAEKPERKRRNNDGKRREGGYRPRSNKNEGGNA